MVVDTHVHLIKPFDSKGNKQAYSKNPASAEDYLAVMESAGIGAAFFISWSPEDIPSDLAAKNIAPESVRETMSREYALDVMARYPELFYWFPCHLGPQVPDHMAMARENLERGAAGLKLVLSFWGELPDDPRPMKIYDLAGEFGAQAIIDTSYWYLNKENSIELLEGHREVARRIKDWPDYERHLRKVFAAYPTVNFQLAHAGARRLTTQSAREVGRLIHDYPNVYCDLGAIRTDSPDLEVLVEAAGADRVMFGTDWPHFCQGPKMSEYIDAVRRPGRFPKDVADGILGGNAVRFVRGRAPGLARSSVR